jgi:hypothetical protein
MTMLSLNPMKPTATSSDAIATQRGLCPRPRGEQHDRHDGAERELPLPEHPPVAAGEDELESLDVAGHLAVGGDEELRRLEEQVEDQKPEHDVAERFEGVAVAAPAVLEDGRHQREQRGAAGQRGDEEQDREDPAVPRRSGGNDTEEGADAAVEHDRQRYPDEGEHADGAAVAGSPFRGGVLGAERQQPIQASAAADTGGAGDEIASDHQPQLDGDQCEVGGVQPDHPRHRRLEVRVGEDVPEALHVPNVRPHRQQGEEQRDESGEECDPTDRLEPLDAEHIHQRRDQERAGRQADEVDVRRDPQSPRDDAAVVGVDVTADEAAVPAEDADEEQNRACCPEEPLLECLHRAPPRYSR